MDVYCRSCFWNSQNSGNAAMPIAPEEYLCYDCQKVLFTSAPRIPCKTTLVFTPAHICVQWIEELRKHISPGAEDTHSINGVFCEGCVNGIRYLLYPGSEVIHTVLKTRCGRNHDFS